MMNNKVKQMVRSYMRPAWWLVTAALLLNVACDDKDEGVKTFKVNVKLEYPEGYAPAKDVVVRLKKANSDDVAEAKTNTEGIAEFTVLAGIYEALVSEVRTIDRDVFVLNGIKSNITVTDSWKTVDETVLVPLSESKSSQLVIKELYVGGCPDDNNGKFYNDKYLILYNNSTASVSLRGLTLAIVTPLNATQSNNADYKNEVLYYEAEGWIPAGYGFWTITNDAWLESGKQIVIALNKAVDNTITHSKSINFANPEYYSAYDPVAWNNTTVYAVSELIPTSHYLKAYKYGTGNAWPISQLSPAFFVFKPENITSEDIASDVNYSNYYNDSESAANHRKKISTGWVIDAIEIFQKGSANNKKRLTAVVDAGYIDLLNGNGYTLYRNVNKEATEAFPENEGKLVYNYSLGTENSTDPSGIDAEASLKNGAHIIYKDTNNSTADFHQRSQASLRD
jgi:hypothetical protein